MDLESVTGLPSPLNSYEIMTFYSIPELAELYILTRSKEEPPDRQLWLQLYRSRYPKIYNAIGDDPIRAYQFILTQSRSSVAASGLRVIFIMLGYYPADSVYLSVIFGQTTPQERGSFDDEPRADDFSIWVYINVYSVNYTQILEANYISLIYHHFFRTLLFLIDHEDDIGLRIKIRVYFDNFEESMRHEKYPYARLVSQHLANSRFSRLSR